MTSSFLQPLFNLTTCLHETIQKAQQLAQTSSPPHNFETQQDLIEILNWLHRALPRVHSCLLRCQAARQSLTDSRVAPISAAIQAAQFRLELVSSQLDICMACYSNQESSESIVTTQYRNPPLHDVEGLAVFVYKDSAQMLHLVKDLLATQTRPVPHQLRDILVRCTQSNLEGLGVPLCRKLRELGMTVSLNDQQSCQFHHRNIIERAWMGIFILSRDFTQQESSMRSLISFQQRQQKALVSNRGLPVLMPIFFDFGPRDCVHWQSICEFHNGDRVGNLTFDEIDPCFQALSTSCGVENYDRGYCGPREEHMRIRRHLVEIIADEVNELCGN